jgi:hypothetical protein
LLQDTTKHSHIQDIPFIMAITATIDTIIMPIMVIVTFRTMVCTVIDTFTVALLGYMACIAIGTFSMLGSLGSMPSTVIGTFIMVPLVSTVTGTFIRHSAASMAYITTGTFLTAL